METLNSMGFVNFWGMTPAFDILNNEYDSTKKSINILISNSNDIRHIIKTVSNSYEKKENLKNENLNFYVYEHFKENHARTILFFHILHDRSVAIRDRVEILMEVYGNTLLSSRTAEYINSCYKELLKFITNDDKYSGPLRDLIDVSNLTYKERDEIAEIFMAYDLKFKFDIEKYRDDRLRFLYKERYDHRDNMADWDYNFKLKNYAPIVKLRHYTDFRRTGVAFEMRICKYNIPNRTLSSYINGRDKTNKDSCFVRGFWGDIVNSPFIGFGVELDGQDEFEYFYKHNNIGYIYDSQEITEFNLSKYIYRLEKDEKYDFLAKEKEKKKEKEKREAKEKIDKIEEVLEEEDSNENNEKEGKEEVVETTKLDNLNLNDTTNYDSTELLIGLKYFNTKIVLLSGNIETVLKRKKFNNIFDHIIMGVASKNLLGMCPQIGAKNFKLMVELNSYMTSFEDKQKTEFNENLKKLAGENEFILEDSNSKYIWKFIHKTENN